MQASVGIGAVSDWQTCPSIWHSGLVDSQIHIGATACAKISVMYLQMLMGPGMADQLWHGAIMDPSESYLGVLPGAVVGLLQAQLWQPRGLLLCSGCVQAAKVTPQDAAGDNIADGVVDGNHQPVPMLCHPDQQHPHKGPLVHVVPPVCHLRCHGCGMLLIPSRGLPKRNAQTWPGHLLQG